MALSRREIFWVITSSTKIEGWNDLMLDMGLEKKSESQERLWISNSGDQKDNIYMGQQNTSVLEYRFKFTVPIARILVRALQRNRTNRRNTHIDTHKHTRSRRRSCDYCSVAKSHPTLCDSMNCSTPGSPVLHHLPKFAETHVHWVSDAIQPSHPLSSPSPPATNPSQHQSLFQWVDSLHQVAKVLELQLQHQSFQWIFRIDFL